MTRDHEEKQEVVAVQREAAEAAPPARTELGRAQVAHTRAAITQLRARGEPGPGSVQRAAAAGVRGSGQSLPYLQRIQQAFGHHDVTAVQAHVGGAAREAADAIGAEAYATGNAVAFRSAPDLHTAAHEAAHIVQQRIGVQLKGGVGQVGDPYERHADAVADRVVQGKSAVDLLDGFAGGGGEAAVQRKEARGGPKKMPHGFQMRPPPTAELWFRAEKERKSDPAMQSAVATVEALAIGPASLNMMGVHAPGSGAAGELVAGATNLANAGGAHGAQLFQQMLQKKWTFYVWDLAHSGRGFDEHYNIIDVTGQVVDTWWKDNWQ